MNTRSGAILAIMINETGEHIVFDSREELDEYVKEHNLSEEEDYIEELIYIELPPEKLTI
jgi:hypothetical protein